MSKILDYERRKSIILDKLEMALLDGYNDALLDEVENLLNEVIWDLEEREEEIEELNYYLDELRR